MKMKKKICVVTGSRAEYGLLFPLIKEILSDKDLVLQLIVTGMHLSKEFGCTYKEIKNDGIKIDCKVDIDLGSDTPEGISNAMGLAMIGFAKAYKKLNPDMVVVLGDRFEIFSAVTSAYVAKIPIAHLHGGEVTEGAIDDAFRHCITKMSYLHFTSAIEYRNRVIQLGESPNRVFNVGAIGLDNIKNLKLLTKSELEKQIGFVFGKKNLLVTYHPVTLENNTSKAQFKNILDALDKLKDTKIIFTKTNADTYGKVINKMIDGYVQKKPSKASVYASLGKLRYLSTLKYVDAVIGNSSSGIIEAPSFKVPTINIGDRQKGRIKADSIIDCSPNKKEISKAISKIYSKSVSNKLKHIVNPYGCGQAAKRIKEELKRKIVRGISLKKEFYNNK